MIHVARLEVFLVMKIQVMVFWILTPCSDLVSGLDASYSR